MEILHGLHAFLWLNPTANNCNTYLIDGEAKILIDPGHRHLFGHVRNELERMDISLYEMKLILVTHAHPDHMEGIDLFPNSHVGIHMEELNFIKQMTPYYGDILGSGGVEPDILFKEGTLEVGDVTLNIFHTPGHSPGSICIYWPDKKVLFSGDLLFSGSIGRTDLPGGNGEKLKESIKRLMDLEIEYLLPGHGEILKGSAFIKANFSEIERFFFPLL